MTLLADESVDSPIVDRLHQDGHTVLYIADPDPGIDDDTVLMKRTAIEPRNTVVPGAEE